MERATQREGLGAGAVFGLLLIAAGLSTLLERAHVLENISVGLWWPLLPISVGIAQIANRRISLVGWTTLGFGLWSLVVMVTPINFAETWPLVLLVWGASMAWHGLASAPAMRRTTEETHVR